MAQSFDSPMMMMMGPPPQHPVHQQLTSGEKWTKRAILFGAIAFTILSLSTSIGFAYSYENAKSGKGILSAIFSISLIICVIMMVLLWVFWSQFRPGSTFLLKVFGNVAGSMSPEQLQGHMVQASHQLAAEGDYNAAQFGQQIAAQHAAYHGQGPSQGMSFSQAPMQQQQSAMPISSGAQEMGFM